MSKQNFENRVEQLHMNMINEKCVLVVRSGGNVLRLFKYLKSIIIFFFFELYTVSPKRKLNFAVAGNRTQVAVLTAVNPLPPELDAPVVVLTYYYSRRSVT